MIYINRSEVQGRVGRDPEWKDVGNGLCTFSVATTESWKDKLTGEWKEETTWHNITLWGEAGKYVMEKIFKGDEVLVCGRRKTRKTDDGRVFDHIVPDFGYPKKRWPKKENTAAAKVDNDDSLPF